MRTSLNLSQKLLGSSRSATAPSFCEVAPARGARTSGPHRAPLPAPPSGWDVPGPLVEREVVACARGLCAHATVVRASLPAPRGSGSCQTVLPATAPGSGTGRHPHSVRVISLRLRRSVVWWRPPSLQRHRSGLEAPTTSPHPACETQATPIGTPPRAPPCGRPVRRVGLAATPDADQNVRAPPMGTTTQIERVVVELLDTTCFEPQYWRYLWARNGSAGIPARTDGSSFAMVARSAAPIPMASHWNSRRCGAGRDARTTVLAAEGRPLRSPTRAGEAARDFWDSSGTSAVRCTARATTPQLTANSHTA